MHGYLVQAANAAPRLCETLAGSTPPTCGGSSLAIDGPDPGALGIVLTESAGTQWSVEPVELSGYVRANGEQLFIEEIDR